MKTPSSLAVTALFVALAALFSNGCSPADSGDYQAVLKAEAASRLEDPAWKPACAEVAVFAAADMDSEGTVQSFCVNPEGQVLVCWDATGSDGEPGSAGSGASGIRLFNGEGRLLKTWPLPFGPQAIALAPSGRIFVGGHGRIARLSPDGQLETSVPSPALAGPMMTDEEIRALFKERDIQSEAEVERYKQLLMARRNDVTGLAATDEDVFVACAAPKGFSYAVYRLSGNLEEPALVVEKLSGCCGQMDIAARGTDLWVAHNGRHRVECFDRDGKPLNAFGRADRRAADGFGGCCEPKNLRFAPDETVLCAESGPPVCIKQFTRDGEFLRVVANPVYDSGCVRATVDVSPDGERFYLLDAGSQSIHVFASK